MSYTHGYTPEQHRAALADLARDICLHMQLCPDCGEPMDYEPESVEEAEVWGAIQRWTLPGGWGCPGCGKWLGDEKENGDAE